MLLRLQLFQAGFHCSNILVERLCACILRILKFLQKKCLFRTQFFQFFRQLCNADSQCLVALHMVYWQFFFLGNQRFALLAFFLDLLYQPGITFQLRFPYGERFLNMRFAAANMGELITEDQHTAPQLLQSLSNGRYGAGNHCCQLLDFGFQLPQKRIVRPDLPVQFAAVRDDSLALQRLCRYALMDSRNLIQSPCGVAAVVNAFLPPGAFQIAVGNVSPRRPPCRKLFLAVPALGDGILPAVTGAFGMLVSPYKPLCIGLGRNHIHLLLADFIGILLLPSLVLCRLKLGGSKTAFFAVSHAEIFLLGLVLPLTLFIQRAHRQQNMGMRIVTVGVMNGGISAHSV